MDADPYQYEAWIEDALRSVVRRALGQVATQGLPGNHHFYITFKTGGAGVGIPNSLKAEYPEEMTIVLQHQFERLVVEDDYFAVTLRFRGKPERLTIPYGAISAFADPSVDFGLQLKTQAPTTAEIVPAPGTATETKDIPAPAKDDDAKPGEVIALDAFRKK